jgi:hypothetical protein
MSSPGRVLSGSGLGLAKAPADTRVVVRLALSPDEAAAALGISRDYLDEHIGHELRLVRRGRRKFVAIKELERWLEATAERVFAGVK